MDGLQQKKYPHFIRLKNEETFSLGGIFEEWTDKDNGELIRSFSIVTTAANPLMARIHNTMKRMPLILDREAEKKWLDTQLTKEEINLLLQPFDEREMLAHTVSKLITRRKEPSNVPGVIKPFSWPELEPAP